MPKNYAVYTKWTFAILFSLVIFLSYRIAASFLVSILTGGLIAHVLKPLQQKSIFRKLSPRLVDYLTFLGLIIGVVVPVGIFVTSLIRQAIQFKDYLVFHEMNSLQYLVDSLAHWPMASYFVEDPVQLQNQIKNWISEFGTAISSAALRQASEVPILLVQTVFVLVSCFVFLTDGERFLKWLSERIPMKPAVSIAIMRSFSQSSKAAAWASLAASGAQTATLLLGFLVLNVPAAVLAAGATFVFSFIPLVGASPVWIGGAVYLYLQGSIGKVVVMVLFGIAAGLVDNVVRTFVLKGPRGLHPLLGLVAVFGGIQVFGLFGVLIGPIVIALLLTMFEVWPKVLD